MCLITFDALNECCRPIQINVTGRTPGTLSTIGSDCYTNM